MGLARDALLVRALGVSAVGTAFNIAFQVPNTFRRLFGEGALSAAFIPEYAQLLRREPGLAHRFASLNTALLTLGLGALVVLMEGALGLALATANLSAQGRAALVYLAVMLPYMPLVCLTAILGAMLQCHARFAAQAGAPIILNAAMIAAAWTWGHTENATQNDTALAVSFAVTLAGFLQVAWCLWDLRRVAHWSRLFAGAAAPTRRVIARMGPVVLGLGTIQIGTLIESWLLVGWPLYLGPTILGAAYPLDASTGAALYNAQRLYQFPLGVFGIALATAVFPLLSRQADLPHAFASTLRRGLRLSLFIGLPATLGLLFVARDLTATIYLGGQVTSPDADRMARLLTLYAAMVGAYSLTHVLTRAFYAKGDTRFPTRISITTVFLSLILAASLMWPLGECGLALASSLAATLQLALLARAAHTRLGPTPTSPLFDAATLRAFRRIFAASLLMLAALWLLRFLKPPGDTAAWSNHALRLTLDSALGLIAYAAAAWLLCREEIHSLFDPHPPTPPSSPQAPPPA